MESERRNYEDTSEQRLDDLAQFSIHAIEKVCYVLTANVSKTILAI